MVSSVSLNGYQLAQVAPRVESENTQGTEEPKKRPKLENRGLPNKIGIDFAFNTGLVSDAKNEMQFFNGTVLRSLGLGTTMDLGIDFAGAFWTGGTKSFEVIWDARFGYRSVEDFNESYNAKYHYKAFSPYPSWSPISLEQTFEYNGTNVFGLNVTPNRVSVPDEWKSRTNPEISDQVKSEGWLTFMPFGGKLRPAIGYYALGGYEKWFPGENIDYQFRGEGDIRIRLSGTYAGWDISGEGSIMGREGTKLIVRPEAGSVTAPDYNPTGDLNDAVWRSMDIYKFSLSTPQLADLVDLTLNAEYKAYGGVVPVNQMNISLRGDFSRKFGWVNQSYLEAQYLSNPVLYVGDNSAYSLKAGFLVDPAGQLGLKRIESPTWLTVKYTHVGLPDDSSTEMINVGFEVNTDFLGGGIKSRGTQVNPK